MKANNVKRSSIFLLAITIVVYGFAVKELLRRDAFIQQCYVRLKSDGIEDYRFRTGVGLYGVPQYGTNWSRICFEQWRRQP